VDSAVKSVTDSVSNAVDAVSIESIKENPAKAVLTVATSIQTVMNAPGQLLSQLQETGVAAVCNMIGAVIPMPSFPAAYLGSMYVGVPHAHAHPPSLIPPAPPVPLPSLGAITLGTCVKVLIAGMPAARVGDLGMAPTCGGFAPFFNVFLGSSKVFFGGARAARMTDMCTVCSPGKPRSMASMLDLAMSALSIAADVTDAVHANAEAAAAESAAAAAEAAASAAASGLAAAMTAAQTASDVIAAALSAMMGKDIAIPPRLPGFVTLGAPTVLVAGFPVPSTDAIAKWLKNKLKGLKSKLGKKGKGKGKKKENGGGCGCPKGKK
jgi:uncharacterized Zn-binding protein involved in type VI secretion